MTGRERRSEVGDRTLRAGREVCVSIVLQGNARSEQDRAVAAELLPFAGSGVLECSARPARAGERNGNRGSHYLDVGDLGEQQSVDALVVIAEYDLTANIGRQHFL